MDSPAQGENVLSNSKDSEFRGEYSTRVELDPKYDSKFIGS